MKYFKKYLYLIAGFITFAIGIIGIFLPLIPTTPLLLLSAACFYRSSDRLYNWLIRNKWFGKYIEEYRRNRTIPPKAKVVAIVAIWSSIGISILLINPILLKIFLLTIAAAVSLYIVTRD
ncbi:YbaN family protein [Evansella halocellulosilytica]|uniref:YbaN family protein n=1 Tax=Evansella halocellulosilytica TaxID=2011013 RepID=UPI000BB85090|nr:YbaN family protein [Evansella halocellulosilytica]